MKNSLIALTLAVIAASPVAAETCSPGIRASSVFTAANAVRSTAELAVKLDYMCWMVSKCRDGYGNNYYPNNGTAGSNLPISVSGTGPYTATLSSTYSDSCCPNTSFSASYWLEHNCAGVNDSNPSGTPTGPADPFPGLNACDPKRISEAQRDHYLNLAYKQLVYCEGKTTAASGEVECLAVAFFTHQKPTPTNTDLAQCQARFTVASDEYKFCKDVQAAGNLQVYLQDRLPQLKAGAQAKDIAKCKMLAATFSLAGDAFFMETKCNKKGKNCKELINGKWVRIK